MKTKHYTNEVRIQTCRYISNNGFMSTEGCLARNRTRFTKTSYRLVQLCVLFIIRLGIIQPVCFKNVVVTRAEVGYVSTTIHSFVQLDINHFTNHSFKIIVVDI